ncbi:molybdopterin-dependent oxidoreductase [Antrihabitans sp. YC2-6]|uniref:molybdopterin-dependent oxidoreductase n=1 Tax=Antrihabitans sp. YC2-6 TaxID=2799498 RepID=UPI0018F36F5C|nr:molybdopterin-dependent oxidoreductase [Antrihabitans sp. YC2-6]MBJ8348948.1 molybdopterin-dependent oxidoreductase [Antrihabitans sp. YC2-6]
MSTTLTERPPQERRVKRRYTASAVTGIIAAAVVIGIGELVSVPIAANSSPFFAIGNTTVDRAPEWARKFAIDTFGTNDKQALFVGMTIAMILAGALIGVAERLKKWAGAAALVLLGFVAVYAAMQRVTADWTYAIPSIVGVVCGAATLVVLIRALDSPEDAETATATTFLPRRRFLALAAAGAAVAASTVVAGRYIRERLVNIVADRENFRLPFVSNKAEPIAPGTDISVPDSTSFITPNATFYRIDTALQVPQLTTQEWRLKIHGMVDNEITIDWDDLTKRVPIERIITLTCVSNEVGGPLAGNATWIGYPIKDILDEVGVQADADMLLSTSIDGWTSGTPVEILRDGRDAILAVAMNGEPLPLEHGYPVRQVVPGLYGFVSATKWVVDWEFTRFDRAEAYWTKRGWGDRAPIKTASRIDVPMSLAPVAPGPVLIAGTAWAQHRGIAKVEIRIDDGPWQEATLAPQYSIDTWRQWTWQWDATLGNHVAQVRATDLAGDVQIEERVPPIPGGSSGWHTRTFIVR